jgi:uncharacterized membrane protein (DUF4010 family)
MAAMELRETLVSVAVAVAAGSLLGVEREQAQRAEGQSDFGGIRTFPLIALVGAAGMILRPAAGLWLPAALALGLVALLAVGYARGAARDPGLSSEVGALIAFVLGALSLSPEVLAGQQRFLLVAGIATISMALLAMKGPLHAFSARVSADDIYATVKFALLAAVLLPVLPDRAYGPLSALNPFKIGLMISLVAGISFAGYLTSRVVGSSRGVLLSGLIGGLVSSTAVAMTFAGRAKQEPGQTRLAAVAIVAASSTMFLRVLVVVAAVDSALVAPLALPLVAMGAGGFAGGAWLFIKLRREGDGDHDMALRNPFEMGLAVKFGLIYGAVLFLSKAAQLYLGRGGVLASSVLAGLTDVDAITLSLTELHRGGLDARTASLGIAAASATNTIVKIALAAALGGRRLGGLVGLSLLAALSCGALALALSYAAA